MHEEGAPAGEIGKVDGAAALGVKGDVSDAFSHQTRVVSSRFTVQPAR